MESEFEFSDVILTYISISHPPFTVPTLPSPFLLPRLTELEQSEKVLLEREKDLEKAESDLKREMDNWNPDNFPSDSNDADASRQILEAKAKEFQLFRYHVEKEKSDLYERKQKIG